MPTVLPDDTPDETPPPLRFGALELAVRDLRAAAAFYRDLLGLEPVGDAPPDASAGRSLRLGPAGGAALLELRAAPDAPPQVRGARRSPGLFHAAFLLPDRADLGRWLLHAQPRLAGRIGQADHLVSEAFYLDDPEGNGIEVYRDRPRSAWPRDPADPARVRMATDPADVGGIVAAAAESGGSWRGAPATTRLGHVHLRVAELASARRFWLELIGFELMASYPGALFVALGGYHHHLGLNTWQSAGADPAPADGLGLRELPIELGGALLEGAARRLERAAWPFERDGDALLLRAPGEIRVRLSALDEGGG